MDKLSGMNVKGGIEGEGVSWIDGEDRSAPAERIEGRRPRFNYAVTLRPVPLEGLLVVVGLEVSVVVLAVLAVDVPLVVLPVVVVPVVELPVAELPPVAVPSAVPPVELVLLGAKFRMIASLPLAFKFRLTCAFEARLAATSGVVEDCGPTPMAICSPPPLVCPMLIEICSGPELVPPLRFSVISGPVGVVLLPEPDPVEPLPVEVVPVELVPVPLDAAVDRLMVTAGPIAGFG
jgi:hypothetical protein